MGWACVQDERPFVDKLYQFHLEMERRGDSGAANPCFKQWKKKRKRMLIRNVLLLWFTMSWCDRPRYLIFQIKFRIYCMYLYVKERSVCVCLLYYFLSKLRFLSIFSKWFMDGTKITNINTWIKFNMINNHKHTPNLRRKGIYFFK